MITCIIIDDEGHSLEMLEWLIRTYCPNVQIEALCNSGEKGIEAIKKFNPDIVFLDIDMPGMSGFDMLEKLDQINFNVVFTTAHDKFAIRAFNYSALHFLLKPVNADMLQETVRRAEGRKMIPQKAQFDLLLQSIRNTTKTVQRIALSSGDGLVFVPVSDIMYCQADSNYTKVILANGQKIVVPKTLKDIDETISGPDFFRIHHSYLININYIKKYVRGDGGYVVMNDNTDVPISRNKREEFFELFSKL